MSIINSIAREVKTPSVSEQNGVSDKTLDQRIAEIVKQRQDTFRQRWVHKMVYDNLLADLK